MRRTRLLRRLDFGGTGAPATGPPSPTRRSSSGIRMQPREEIIDAEIGEERGQEAADGDPGRPLAFPANDDARVEIESEDEPGDQAPDLLGVPGPIAAPGPVGPEHAEDEPP